MVDPGVLALGVGVCAAVGGFVGSFFKVVGRFLLGAAALVTVVVLVAYGGLEVLALGDVYWSEVVAAADALTAAVAGVVDPLARWTVGNLPSARSSLAVFAAAFAFGFAFLTRPFVPFWRDLVRSAGGG